MQILRGGVAVNFCTLRDAVSTLYLLDKSRQSGFDRPTISLSDSP